ncbi:MULTISPECIES: signal peptidase II [Clostridium]|uniref:Signal peptidase II n=1 Tax=Clostridium botulinum TaxID=1491 RepID=A0A6B4QHG8_CLOBO|nr:MULTISPECIES: signal peptidase II [Clostridium]EES50000.1 putative membrane protein [Clostridium botulinum E1 str. 'BoNT E Beluga']MBN1036943.1 signal peptidase II [Clostridium botulinum]MBN1043644.1 signal peptidase II [Clostridium botulinum]MBN1066278.1 signal peptidase II [Clostridium botulinum]MBN1072630.1 signal peptidase II [Clostridium botulinum]
MNNKKILTVGILPLMWFLYFLFELFTGRIKDIPTVILNIFLMFLFALVGLFIYKIGHKNQNGFKFKTMLKLFLSLMIIDQGIKIFIKLFYFDAYIDIIPNLLSFNPIINTDGSWLNARFGTNVSFPLLILFNIIALFVFVEIYRYALYKGNKDFWADMSFLFIFCGALCSLIDKLFYGGSLDFIGISNLFIADIKDIYINLGILFFILTLFNNGYLSSDEETTLKEDLQNLKCFLTFIKNDIYSKFKLLKNK